MDMSRRFTETEKWRDPWFRKLSGSAKLLFLWLVDNCDKAGVIDLDLESATFDIGQPINSDHLGELESRWIKLPNGKFHMPKFVPFQYRTLSEKCTPHLRVIETIRSHGLSFPLCDEKSSRVVSTLETTNKRGKEGRGVGKEEGGVQRGNPSLDEVKLVVAKAGLPESDAVWFWNKCEGNGWTNGGKPIKSWQHTIAAWKAAGYMASQKQNGHPIGTSAQPAPTVYNLKSIIEAKQNRANELKNQHATEGPLTTDWDDDRSREEWVRLRGEVRQLNQKIASLA